MSAEEFPEIVGDGFRLNLPRMTDFFFASGIAPRWRDAARGQGAPSKCAEKAKCEARPSRPWNLIAPHAQ